MNETKLLLEKIKEVDIDLKFICTNNFLRLKPNLSTGGFDFGIVVLVIFIFFSFIYNCVFVY